MAVTGNTTNVSWVRPDIGTLHGALTHYVVVYNRTILSGVTSNFTTNSEQVPAGSDPAQTVFSYQILGLTAGSRYEISIEPCRMAVCGPAATTSTNTSNAGTSDCVQSALGTVRNIHPGACSAMGTGGTCTPQKFSIWVIAIVMYANML